VRTRRARIPIKIEQALSDMLPAISIACEDSACSLLCKAGVFAVDARVQRNFCGMKCGHFEAQRDTNERTDTNPLEMPMKTNSTTLLLLSIIAAFSLSLNQPSSAQNQADGEKAAEKKLSEKSDDSSKPAAAPQKPLPSDPEERFKTVFTKASLSGRWAALKDGALGEERTGDKYQIVSVTKGSGENWTVNAKMKYRDQEIVMPIPVQVKFAGDTAILVVDNLMIPGGGTYTARLLIYDRTYSGTWKGQRGGGMLYGTITNDTE
jgi:hypothetical protein